MYETLDYQYSDCNEPSFELTQYRFMLMSVDGKWYIASIESDNDFYQSYMDGGFDLQSRIDSFDKARNLPENIAARNAIVEENNASESLITPTAASNLYYSRQNAASYALTYSTTSDNGNQTPSYKNPYFYWNNSSCMLFASQCVWAGFGGSNTQSDITNKRVMDNIGTSNSYKWWSTGSSCTASWSSCENFRQYVTNSRTSSDVGLYCRTLYVESDQTSMYGVENVMVPYLSDSTVASSYGGHYSVSGTKSSPFTASSLIGAVMHVHGSGGILGHAVIVTNANGITRDTIYITAYNNCRKNVKMSLYYPTGSYQDVYVIAPTYFRDGQTGTRLYADLCNVLNNNTSYTLKGISTASVSSLTMSIYAPGATTPSATKTVYNASEVTRSYSFGTTGTWRVEISSPGLQTYTYTVRVVQY